MTTAKKAFFLYRDWCIAKYLREDANWADYPEIFVSAWEYAWNDGFDTVSHESIYTNKHASRYLVGGMVDKDDEGSYYTFFGEQKGIGTLSASPYRLGIGKPCQHDFYKKLIGGITDAKNFAVRKYKRQKGSPVKGLSGQNSSAHERL